jgi:HlyD family secretion protein
MNRRNIIIGVLVLAILAAGYYGLSGRLRGGNKATPTPASSAGMSDNIVTASGTVVPAKQARLGFRLGGRVRQVLVKASDTVQAGEPLLRLEASELEAAVAQAKAGVVAAQAQLALAKSGARPQEIAAAEAGLAAARAQLAQVKAGPRAEQIAVAQAQVQQAATNLARAQSLYDQVRGLGGSMEQDALYQRDAAGATLAAAQAQLDLVKAGATVEEIAAAQATVDQAQAQLDLLKAGARPEELAAAQAHLDQATAAYNQALAALAEATLTAPFAGTVTAVAIHQGELAAPGLPIVTLGDLSVLRIKTTDLGESDVGRLQVGQTATVTFDALPGMRLQARVAEIAPMASSEQAGTNYTVTLDLAQTDPGLRWGMTAYVDVKVDKYR